MPGFQPGQKRGDADATRNPDLLCLWLDACQLKLTIRTLGDQRLSHLQARSQIVCVIPQCLDVKFNDPIISIRTGNGEGMRTLDIVESDESELSGMMPRPYG